MNAKDITFGEFLQRKREEKEITLRRMADKLGFSAPFLSDVEKGRRNPPDLAKLEQIDGVKRVRVIYDMKAL